MSTTIIMRSSTCTPRTGCPTSWSRLCARPQSARAKARLGGWQLLVNRSRSTTSGTIAPTRAVFEIYSSGWVVNDKQAEYLGDILESGRHVLSLINDVLDLSKIEAGRMELDPTDFDLPTAIENTLILVRERAQRRGITLGRTVDEHLGMIRADERKLK